MLQRKQLPCVCLFYYRSHQWTRTPKNREKSNTQKQVQAREKCTLQSGVIISTDIRQFIPPYALFTDNGGRDSKYIPYLRSII